ncbi:MAG: hypothetical protein LUC91_01445 [Prevotella sp.]|nr:hypothetical protein [Prevotella sp.]
MANKDNVIESTDVETSVELRIAKAIASVKRTSERVIGITATDYTYSALSYMATTVRPEPITPLERAVVGIIDIDNNASLEGIGKILGLDIVHDVAEYTMLLESIDKMKGYGMLEGDESYFSLTEKGKVFAAEGERPITYNKSFEISYDPNHPEYLYLSNDFSSANRTIEKCDPPTDEMSLQEIKNFAEVQAPEVQNAKNRYILQSAVIKEANTVTVCVYVFILQSIRNEEDFRVFAYDDTQNAILPHFSGLIQSDKEWTVQLLDQCISNSLKLPKEDGGWTIVPANQEKNEEQKEIEAELVQQEDKESEGGVNCNELERLHKKALYDQVSFELELDKIFKQDNPDEVWLISPFVNRTFLNVRVKQFEPLLKANKRIFIAYSEPYYNKPTISQEAHDDIMKEIERLSKLYPNFYCVELPQFHTKQVLEVKKGQCVLFNGSFNVLSFNVLSSNNVSIKKKVSREEMALVHYQIAISKRQEYIETFANIYENEILNDVRNSEPKKIAKIKCDRIDYLRQISEKKENFVDFYTEYDEKTLQAKNSVWYGECDSLHEKINQAIGNDSINVNEYKNIKAAYSSLIKDAVLLTVNSDVVSNLEEAYAELDRLRSTKDNQNNKQFVEVPLSGSITDMAKEIINNAKLDDEKSVTKYVAALNFLYSKREFKNIDEGTKHLKKLLYNTSGFSYVSVFDYRENMFGTRYDATIGIGGYSFRLNSILPKTMEKKIESLKRPRGRISLQNVNKDDIEKTLRKILNK